MLAITLKLHLNISLMLKRKRYVGCKLSQLALISFHYLYVYRALFSSILISAVAHLWGLLRTANDFLEAGRDNTKQRELNPFQVHVTIACRCHSQQKHSAVSAAFSSSCDSAEVCQRSSALLTAPLDYKRPSRKAIRDVQLQRNHLPCHTTNGINIGSFHLSGFSMHYTSRQLRMIVLRTLQSFNSSRMLKMQAPNVL